MNSIFDDTPEVLVELRTTVEDWVRKARKSVLSFSRDDGSFWRDSRVYKDLKQGTEQKVCLTTTSRSFMALVYADQCLTKSGEVGSSIWKKCLADFVATPKLQYEENSVTGIKLEEIKSNKAEFTDDDKVVNAFDLAHLADLEFAADYIKRFDHGNQIDTTKLIKNRKEILGDVVKGIIHRLVQDNGSEKFIESGQMYFRSDEPETHHFFVTLHTLRALAILNSNLKLEEKPLNCIVETARQFCVQQCYYAQRGNRHQRDTIRLAFAGVVYCLYSTHFDKDLCIAVIETLAAAQQENGSWPTIHPVFRQKKGPWHISSQEIAVCLTWLYFQPRIPDAARVLLLDMMEKYFSKWVVPTFVRVPKNPGKTDEEKKGGGAQNTEESQGPNDDVSAQCFEGWYDDHTVSHNVAVGWATAIICHFLSNFYSVLGDHINRRVIESLDLNASSMNYLIDETAHQKSLKWPATGSVQKEHVVIWPDLPPYAWSEQQIDSDLAKVIRWHWTDPSCPGCKESISDNLARSVLLPVFKTPNGLPNKTMCVGLLPGPPGTRKTSLVETLASILKWPLVTVPASVIFDSGFDQMEARANEVFRRLNYLTGFVIFFDEFEEFFRSRDDDLSTTHDRTIAAFTTSAMLPRLQELHDQARCLIFLATNHEDKIDSAIKRSGRIDFRLPIDHPKRERILKYLDKPTKRTLKDLGMEPDDEIDRENASDNAEFYKLKDVVKAAVADVFHEDEEVRFKFVEGALKAVAGLADDNAKKLKDRAKESLKKSRQLATDQKGDPPDIWDL